MPLNNSKFIFFDDFVVFRGIFEFFRSIFVFFRGKKSRGILEEKEYVRILFLLKPARRKNSPLNIEVWKSITRQ